MRSILVIDDEPSVSKLIQIALARKGYHAETAANGREGLSKFDSGRFDLVITDIRMPDMDGHQVASHIRASKTPETPVVACSGTPWMLEDDNQFTVTFSKPFSLNKFTDRIEKLLP